MKIFWALLYNALLYPLIFLFAMVGSVFQDKLRASVLGRFRSSSVLKQYFKSHKSNTDIYWFHAASLGEFYQVKPVVEGLKEIRDEITILVSFSSPSGYDNAMSNAIDLKVYIPFDFPWTIKKVLNIVRPKKIIFASYDIWPNMIWMARRKEIHTNIFSARVKVGSPKLKTVVKQFYRAVYSSLSSIYTVSEKDMEGIHLILGKT